MKGKELRQFALECLKAARQTDQVTDKESYRVIAEGLIRRASEVEEVAAPRLRRRGNDQHRVRD